MYVRQAQSRPDSFILFLCYSKFYSIKPIYNLPFFYCVAILHTIQGHLCGKMVDFFCLPNADNGDFYCIYYYSVYNDWKDMHLVLFYFGQSYFDLFDDLNKIL